MSDTNANSMTVEISGAQLRLLQYFHDKYDKDHSLTYTFEECLVAGIKAKTASKTYSETTRNEKKFHAEIASDPSIILHPDRMLKVMRKYGIGSSNAKLEDQVQDAASKMLEEQTKPAAPEKAA
jgi:hypothetical protein